MQQHLAVDTDETIATVITTAVVIATNENALVIIYC